MSYQDLKLLLQCRYHRNLKSWHKQFKLCVKVFNVFTVKIRIEAKDLRGSVNSSMD